MVELTRETRSDFIVVSDVVVAFDGMVPQEFIGAEFHSGVFHRIEDANFRVVANCESRVGHQLTLARSEVVSDSDIADAACGIGPFSDDAELNFLGEVETEFGSAIRVEVNDFAFVRTYDLLPNGAILRNVWRKRDADDVIVYKSEAKNYCVLALPARAFTKSSLSRSFRAGACD